MNKRPVIGITATYMLREENEPLSQHMVSRDYVRGIIAAGGLPLMIPTLRDNELIDTYCDLIDGLLLPGGGDISPKAYGDEPGDKLYGVNEFRDSTEIALIHRMYELNKPVFGICRGMQVINTAFGGKMYQDLESEGFNKHSGDMSRRPEPWHEAVIEKGTRLDSIFDEDVISVNSFHHQGVKVPGKGLTVTARSKEDGVVEALEHENGRIFGVEWHPENMFEKYKEFFGLFKSFVDQCAEVMDE